MWNHAIEVGAESDNATGAHIEHGEHAREWPAGRPDWRIVDRALRAIRRSRAALDAEEMHWLREAEALKIPASSCFCAAAATSHITAACSPSPAQPTSSKSRVRNRPAPAAAP